MSEALINSFSTFVKSVETETNVLKCLTNLRALDVTNENIVILNELDQCLSKLEDDFESIEAMIDEENEVVNKFEELCSLCREQNATLKKMHAVTPIVLPTVSTLQEPQVAHVVNATQKTQPTQENKRLEEITGEEFERVSKTTRGRLTLPVVQKSYRVLLDMFAKKKKEYHLPRSKLTPQMILLVDEYNSKRHVDHGKQVFLTENEIRSSVLFEHGEASGRAILQTLRQLQRLRMLRSCGVNTYY